MKTILKRTQRLSQNIYSLYDRGHITQNEYLKLLKPLDEKIEKIESSIFTTHPQDIFVFEKASL